MHLSYRWEGAKLTMINREVLNEALENLLGKDYLLDYYREHKCSSLTSSEWSTILARMSSVGYKLYETTLLESVLTLQYRFKTVNNSSERLNTSILCVEPVTKARGPKSLNNGALKPSHLNQEYGY